MTNESNHAKFHNIKIFKQFGGCSGLFEYIVTWKSHIIFFYITWKDSQKSLRTIISFFELVLQIFEIENFNTL